MFNGEKFSQVITHQGNLVRITGRLDSVEQLPPTGSYNQMYLIGAEDATRFEKYLWNVSTQQWVYKGVSVIMDWDDKQDLLVLHSSGTAAAQEITEPRIPELYEGLKFVIIPSVNLSASPTLNINGLGAIPIKRRNNTNGTLYAGARIGWLTAEHAYTLVYSNGNFIVTEFDKVSFTDTVGYKHDSTSTTYGAGSKTNYGHVKLVDDLEHSTYADGEALAASAGYKLKDLMGDLSRATNLQNGEATGSLRSILAIASVSEGSVALGTGATAGSKCFNITAFDEAHKTYTLDSVEGLAVGDVFSLKLFNNYENIGKIIGINGNVVSVDNYQVNEKSDVKYFRVPLKPTCGTTDFGIAAFAEGENCKAIGPNSHASGLNTIANGVCAHTEGRETTANYASHAEGGWTNANGQYAHTEGNSTEADANFAHAEGYQSKVTELGPMGHAEGNKTIVSAQSAHAEGRETIASGLYSHAEGYKTIVSAQAAHAEGDGATATGYASHAEGYKTKAANTYAHAEGKEVNASGYTSHAEGCGTIASGNNAHAEGDSATASGAGAHSEGYYSKAIGEYSHAEGKETVASGVAAHAEGWQATASGAYSHAEGYSSATKQYAHSEGYYVKATGNFSHAENDNTESSGVGSHAEGYKTVAQGDYSHAEGNNNVAQGANSHVEGKDNTANGDCSHAENAGNEATGKYSHAEGWGSKAQGIASHAENYSLASAEYSHSEGYGTIAYGRNQHVQGKYNIEDTVNKYAHIVGNGTSDTSRSNAHTLDWSGNAWYAGHVEASDIWLRSPGGKLFCLSVDDNGKLLTTQINSDGSEIVEID